MHSQKRVFYKIIACLLCLNILSACQNSINVSKGNIDKKEDVETLIKEKRYDGVQIFVTDNIQSEEKRLLVEFAISSLAKNEDTANFSFLNNMFQTLIIEKDWDTFKK